MWDWVLYVVMFLLLLVGLFVNLLGMPGLWLMVLAGVAYALLTGLAFMGYGALVALLILAVAAEIVEFAAGAAGSKSAGGSKRAMLGAIAGGLIGGILGTGLMPIIGTLLGAVLGAFIGAVVVELLVRKDVEHSLRVGIGAARGRFWGTVFKSAFGLSMLVVALWTGWPGVS